PADNPFLHDRKKTFQPRDLWDWLLKMAVILFPVDVGVRRIQLDRAEWLKAMRQLRRWLFFWQGVPRAPEAEESLAALLARRGQVRASQTGPASLPNPELFRPKEQAPLTKEVEAVFTKAKDQSATQPSPAPTEQTPTSTASRLLDAKRRAQRWKEK